MPSRSSSSSSRYLNANTFQLSHTLAAELIALGLAGAMGESYQALDEGLPLLGYIGVLGVLDEAAVQDHGLPQPPTSLQPGADSAAPGTAADLPPTQASVGVGSSGDADADDTQGAPDQDDEFEMWMQLVRSGGGV